MRTSPAANHSTSRSPQKGIDYPSNTAHRLAAAARSGVSAKEKRRRTPPTAAPALAAAAMTWGERTEEIRDLRHRRRGRGPDRARPAPQSGPPALSGKGNRRAVAIATRRDRRCGRCHDQQYRTTRDPTRPARSAPWHPGPSKAKINGITVILSASAQPAGDSGRLQRGVRAGIAKAAAIATSSSQGTGQPGLKRTAHPGATPPQLRIVHLARGILCPDLAIASVLQLAYRDRLILLADAARCMIGSTRGSPPE